jgi:hypothetical protein
MKLPAKLPERMATVLSLDAFIGALHPAWCKKKAQRSHPTVNKGKNSAVSVTSN